MSSKRQASAHPPLELAALASVGAVRLIDRHFAESVVPEEETLCRSVVAMASRYLGEGHVCLPLASLAEKDLSSARDGSLVFPPEQVLRQAVTACIAVEQVTGSESGGVLDEEQLTLASPSGEVRDVRPLILDESGRLYLRRYYQHEQLLAQRLKRLLAQRSPAGSDYLDEFFVPGECDPDQRAAAQSALGGGLSVVSGGPGTGKTSTVVRLLAVLGRRALDRKLPFAKVILLAPTGKAAARLSESIREAKQRLGLPAELLAGISEEVTTIHRALGVRQDNRTRFRHDAELPLEAEVIIVDEASMVDLSLMRCLMDAVAPGAQVILLGDRDQLASVEAGSVLSELCDALPPAETIGQPGAFVQLKKSYRFGADSGISALAQKLRQGDSEGTMQLLSEERSDVQLYAGDASGALRALRTLLVGEFRRALEQSSAAEALVELAKFRVLCAHRQGPFGAVGINERLLAWLAQESVLSIEGEFFPGRLLMVTQNDASVSLSNGDVGLVWRNPEGGTSVYFQRPDGIPRAVSPAELPAHETAFAMTIHKSQGSEYDHVCVVLPGEDSPLLSRELLYTAVTRAKSRVTLFASEPVVRQALARRVSRYSGLGDALR